MGVELTDIKTPKMPQNVEIKARVPDRAQLIKNIENNTNAEWTALLDQHDTFYNAPNARLKLRRIPSHGMYQLISYSRSDTLGPKVSEYVFTSIDDKELAEQLHENLKHALGVKTDLKKQRSLYMLGPTRIHVDTVEGLGEFVEFEVVLEDGDSVEAGQKVADALMVKLGILKEHLMVGAYADHLMKDNSKPFCEPEDI